MSTPCVITHVFGIFYSSRGPMDESKDDVLVIGFIFCFSLNGCYRIFMSVKINM